MFNPETSTDTPNIISSVELEAGPSPCISQIGLQTDLFGPQVSHVNRLAYQAESLASKMKDTYFNRESDLLKHASQNAYSESKYQVWNGLTPRPMQWQMRVTNSGLAFGEQIPLDPFKNADGSIGRLLPTPMASDNRNRGSINKTPSVTRRMNSGKQIGLSMLFDGKPCPFCVAGMMGYPQEWVRCAVKALETR